MVVVCCHCKEIKEIVGDPDDLRVSHGVCEPCIPIYYPHLVEKIYALRAERMSRLAGEAEGAGL